MIRGCTLGCNAQRITPTMANVSGTPSVVASSSVSAVGLRSLGKSLGPACHAPTGALMLRNRTTMTEARSEMRNMADPSGVRRHCQFPCWAHPTPARAGTLDLDDQTQF